MKIFSRNFLIIALILFSFAATNASCFAPKPKNKTDKRIKKQKKRQKKNPGDCPRIDCK